MARSALHVVGDDIEAAAQQPVQDENISADGDKSSRSNEPPELLTYEQRLFRINRRFQHGRLANAFVDFDKLSRMNILHLMNELAKYEQAMQKNKPAPQDIEQLGDLLHRYSKSVKVAIVIVFSLRCLHVSYRCSGPRILVQAPQPREYVQERISPGLTARYVPHNLS